ncbi:NAD(P)H-hydrate epimerase [Myroides sp. LJL115]
MKIFSSAQSKELVAQTISNQYISSFKLIEKAALKTMEALSLRHKLYHSNFIFLCGTTTNGALALALARMVKEAGGFVKVYLVQSKKYSPDNVTNQDLMQESGIKVEKFLPNKHSITIREKDIIIDGLFGIGLKDILEENWAEFFSKLNQSPALDRISIEIPSGMFCDKATSINAPVFKANMVYTFQSPKLSLLFASSGECAASFSIVDVGLDASAQNQLLCKHFYTTGTWVKQRLQKNMKFSTNKELGHGIIIGGDSPELGKVILGASAALKTGLGKLCCYVPQNGYLPIVTQLWQVNCLCDPQQHHLSQVPSLSDYNAVSIGLGIDKDSPSQKTIITALSEVQQTSKLIISSRAVEVLVQNPKLLDNLPSNCILYIQPRQLEVLVGKWEDDFEKLAKLQALSTQKKLIFILEASHIQIVLPEDQIFFNSTSSLPFAGSSEVLHGVILGLLAKGYDNNQAAILGVYIHGLAYQLAHSELSYIGLNAMDLIPFIDKAFKEVMTR